MKLTPATTLAAIVLIGAGGFMAGRISSPADGASADATSAAARPGRAATRDLQASSADARKSPNRASARGDRAGSTSPEDRLAKLTSIVRGENPLERNRALLAYIDQLGPGDFEDAVAGFRSLGITESRMGEYSLLLTAWAQTDPTRALDFAKENTQGAFARDTILTTWGTTDPEAAIRWAQANFEGDGANPYLAGIIRGLSAADPARATEVLAGMPRSGERGQGLDYLMPHLLQQGTAATRDWIDGLADESLRNGAMMRATDQLAAADPAGTVSWMLQNPGDASQRRLDDAYGIWAAKDSQAALSSFSALPPGNDRSNAMRGVIGTMASQDPQAALALMNRYPNDATDGVVQNFIWRSFGNDPAVAASQISRITDQVQREQTYRRTLDRWYDRDPASVVAWAQGNALPDSVRNHLNRRQAAQ